MTVGSSESRVQSVRVVESPFGGGALTRAALTGATLPGWYADVPAGKDEWTERCRIVARDQGPWLAAITPAVGAVGARLLERVADGRGVVVTTGQQPGLFGGPWYTWFKAMAAREFAAEIQKETGVPAVPVFWAATDDADFAEAATTVIDTPFGAERLTLSDMPPYGVPMSHATLGEEIRQHFERLAAVAGSMSAAKPLRAAEAAFCPGATIGDAYVQLLRSLLEGAGIVVLDASHPSVADAARPHLQRALARAGDVHAALAARNDEITRAGFEVQVDVERELSLVFAWEPGADGLPRKRRITLAEAANAASNGRVSPTVLLRPVIERLLLPTVGYLGGPGEVAYFAQVSAVAAALDAPLPLVLPRWSGMLIPREVDDTLTRLDIDPEALRDPALVESRIARAALPPDTAAALSRLRDAVDDTLARIDGLLTPEALSGAKGQFEHRIERLERRLIAAAKHRDGDTLRAVAAARGTLFPFGEPQERALNAIPLLARHGTEVGLAIRAACAAHARRLITGTPVHA